MSGSTRQLFDLSGRVSVITGGAGMLGRQHATAIAEMGGHPVLADVSGEAAVAAAADIERMHGVAALGMQADVTDKPQVEAMVAAVLQRFGHIDILINNAALTVKGGSGADARLLRPL